MDIKKVDELIRSANNALSSVQTIQLDVLFQIERNVRIIAESLSKNKLAQEAVNPNQTELVFEKKEPEKKVEKKEPEVNVIDAVFVKQEILKFLEKHVEKDLIKIFQDLGEYASFSKIPQDKYPQLLEALKANIN